MDIHFFSTVIKDNRDNQYLIKDDEVFKKVFARAMHLYKELTDIALENERKN